ncbi:unnamed protein product [Rotaria sp. Silwood1]|nr:unnamed protein product [Rotaria sp. Silwood1]CAF3945258.1 unnamed protein product [Rotaria sp. Silwood1]CAF4990867.1 unnamed protein product [Rotaria sp. Silwood1]CAF5025015.1 unnamed protein product [Rotaria sp. Silwood1]CAF5112018.1 unnamed protein product [Rotaria sp. Silwood1]
MRERDDIQDLNIRWLCPNCYTFEMKELRQNKQEETQRSDLEEEEEEHTTSDEPDSDNEDSEENVSSQSDCTTSCSSQDSSGSDGDLYELNYKQEKALEELKTIFAALDLPPIHDQSKVAPIRQQIDELYRKLHHLCDVLESTDKNSNDPNPHDILVSESNQLLSGLKNLYHDSDESDQIRIMTIAPKHWGREKIRKW